MRISLSKEQKQALLIQHDTTRDGRVRDRIKAVIHASNNWTPEEIANALLIHETTVRQYIKEYLLSNKLKPENGGSKSYLSQAQTQELIAHLTARTYHHSQDIVAYIINSYQIQYSVAGIKKWLHQNCFNYKQQKVFHINVMTRRFNNRTEHLKRYGLLRNNAAFSGLSAAMLC